MWRLVYTEEIAEIWEIFLHLELSIMPWLSTEEEQHPRNDPRFP